MNLNKAKEIYGSLLEQANQARQQLILENSDNFAYQTELSEEAKDEFKAISVLTSVAFRSLVNAGLQPEPVPNKPGFMKINVNDKEYMCLGSILQGTLEQAITKAALREEAENIGINTLSKKNDDELFTRNMTTIHNNGINASDLAEIVKAAVSAVQPMQSVLPMQQTMQIEEQKNVVEDVYIYTPREFQNEFECELNQIIFEVDQFMYSSNTAIMRNFLILAAPLEIYKTAQNHVPIFVYAESDEEIVYTSAYDNFTSDGKVKITLDDIVLYITGAFDAHGGFHIKVEAEDEFIRLITSDKRNNGNALVSKNGHPKFHLDNDTIIDVIPIGIDSDNYIVIQRMNGETAYIQMGPETGLDSALIVTNNQTFDIEPVWNKKKLIINI